MVAEVRAFAVTIPPGGSAAAPQTFDVSFPPRIVRGVEIVVPDGPRGNVGFGIGAGGTVLFPANAGALFITNDETIHWWLDNQIDSGAWQVVAYNIGQLSHTLFFRFLLDLVQAPAPGVRGPLALSA